MGHTYLLVAFLKSHNIGLIENDVLMLLITSLIMLRRLSSLNHMQLLYHLLG